MVNISKNWTHARIADSVGSTAAMFCAIHCALLPVMIALLPALGLGALTSSTFEWAFVVLASGLALASLWHGYRKHRIYHALAFLLPGLLAVWAGILIPGLHHSVIPHAITMSVGGILISVAHIINLRLTSRNAATQHGNDCCYKVARSY